MRFDVVGAQVKIDPDAVRRLIEATSKEVLTVAGEIVVSEIKQSFTSSRGTGANEAQGRWYDKYEDRGNSATIRRKELHPIQHRASAPNQPPAVDTGTLRASINYYYDAQNNRCLIGTPVEYAGALEFGQPPKLKPRPFFRPAVYRYAGNDRLVKKIVVQLKAMRRMRGQNG